MQIARQKKQENIAEYVLYMYQIEDIIRAYGFDVDVIMSNYVAPHLPDPSYEKVYREWYEGLVKTMKQQKIEKSGHLPEIQEVMMELSYLHTTLINLQSDHKYKDLFATASPFIDEFKEKSNLAEKNHVETAFHAMYMKLLLRLKGKEITPESEDAFDAMRIMLAYLSKSYKQMKAGDMDFLSN